MSDIELELLHKFLSSNIVNRKNIIRKGEPIRGVMPVLLRNMLCMCIYTLWKTCYFPFPLQQPWGHKVAQSLEHVFLKILRESWWAWANGAGGKEENQKENHNHRPLLNSPSRCYICCYIWHCKHHSWQLTRCQWCSHCDKFTEGCLWCDLVQGLML